MLLEGVAIANPTTTPETPLPPIVTLPLIVARGALSAAGCAFALIMALRRKKSGTILRAVMERLFCQYRWLVVYRLPNSPSTKTFKSVESVKSCGAFDAFDALP